MDQFVKSYIVYILTAAVVIATAAAGLPACAEGPQPGGSSLEHSLRMAMVPPEPVLLPPVEQPADENGLTLTDAEQIAAANHPAVREAEAEVRAARGRWLQVGLPPNPEVGYSGEEIGDEGSAGKQGGFVSQEVVTSGKLGLNRSMAVQDVAAAEQRLALSRLRVTTMVRQYYFETLAADRSEALSRQLVTMAERAVKVSDLRLKAMEGTRADMLQSQIERDSAELLQGSAANRHEAAWRRLAAAIGRDPSVPAPLQDVLSRPLPALSWEPARERLLAESPELAELRCGVERAKWASERAAAGRVPNVNVWTGVQYDDATEDTIANVQVSVPLPVYDRNQGRIAEACGQLAAARAALERRQLELEQRLADALRDYTSARERVTRYEKSILPAARESLDMVVKAYDQGEIDYLQLLSTQRVFTQNSLAYLQDLETAWRKWAEIEGLLVVGPDTGSD
jgi:cobalt-zinc-cadmium efflux system outer membrane protein